MFPTSEPINTWVKCQGNESVVQIPGSKVATFRNCLGKIREAQVQRNDDSDSEYKTGDNRTIVH